MRLAVTISADEREFVGRCEETVERAMAFGDGRLAHVHMDEAEGLAFPLDAVRPCGLGARDSLR
jgi:hypothetical protein